jgi:FhaA, N-terminal domain/FHA domain
MLSRFERMMELAVEGGMRRVFATSLQPIQLAKAAARAMEQAQVIGPRGLDVPNRYELHLAIDDMARFTGYVGSLEDEIRAYLVEYARDRGLRPVGELQVVLVEDGRQRPGTVRAVAQFAGLSTAVQHEVDAAIEGTRRLRLADLAAARGDHATSAAPELRLTDANGLDFVLETSLLVVRLGRAADNDVQVPGKAVSRYHSQLRWVESSWLIYDLNSTNGTFVDDQRVNPEQPKIALPRSVLRLGDYPLEVQASDPRGRR